MTEHPELTKGRRHLFIPIKDNNVGKELSAATTSRWICSAPLQLILMLPSRTARVSQDLGKNKAHEVRALATSLQHFNKVDLQAVMKAGRFSSGGTFTSFYFRDLCPQADNYARPLQL